MINYAARAASADTFPKLLRLNAREHAGEIAYREKDFGVWRAFTWAEYQARVRDFALGLVELGLASHDVVAQRTDGQYVLLRQGDVRLFPVRIRYAYVSELDLMARLAGLQLRERWGSWRREPFPSPYRSHISVWEPAGPP